MKDRTGSSLPRLKQWILAKYPDLGGPHFNSRLNKALRNGLVSKPPKLIKFRASYKIPIEWLAAQSSSRKSISNSSTASGGGKSTPANSAASVEAQKRSEMLKKRHYPMEDTKLHAQDRQFRVKPASKPRPTLPYFWHSTLPQDHPHRFGKTPGNILAGSRVDADARGLVPDLLQVYHFFRGDVRFVLDDSSTKIVPDFSLQHLIFSVEQALNGNVRKCKQIPPLLVHLFVTALQILLSGRGLTSSREESNLYTELHTYLEPVLNASNWADITHLYMDAMERYFTGTRSEPPVPDVGFAVAPEEQTGLYLKEAALWRAHMKLGEKDPWFLSAEELMALLRALTEDVLALFPDILDQREGQLQTLMKEKRSADAKLRKVRLAYEGPPPKKANGKKENGKVAALENREKPFKPTASKRQFETAKKEQEKAAEAYEQAAQVLVSRTEPIGYDRHFNAVYSSPLDPDLIIVEDKRPAGQTSRLPPTHQPERRMWHVIETTSMFDQYVASLDVRGRREHDLKKALEPLREHLRDDVAESKREQADAKTKAKLEHELQVAQGKCENGRSGRLAETAEEELAAAQESLEAFKKRSTSTGAGHSQRNYENLTGLWALQEFEQGESQQARRKRQKKAAEISALKLPSLYCSKLYSSGELDGSGMVGILVADILNLEEHCQSIVPWNRSDKSRDNWIAKVQGAVHAWNSISPYLLGPSDSQMNGVEVNSHDDTAPCASPNGSSRRASAEAKRRKMDSPGSITSGEKVSTILYMLRQPLLDLEERVADITNVALATRDAEWADDNISVESDKPEITKVEEWKKLAHKIRNTPSRKYGQIRQLLVSAISEARKSHLPAVVARLRAALLLYHPSAAGDCKAAVVKTLDDFGGYEETDDDDDEEEKQKDSEESEESIPSVLSAEAVILRSSLAGSEEANREDWANAVRSSKTLSRFASLSNGFVRDAMVKIEKLEIEREALLEALVEWKKDLAPRPKGRRKIFVEPSEVWTLVDYTDEICMAKAEDFPWWPARKCVPKDGAIAASLSELDRCIVAFVGEMGGLRVVKTTDQMQPFTGEMVGEVDVTYSKTMRNTLDECMVMARRLQRGIEKSEVARAFVMQEK